jgi:pyruvate kinase
VKSVPCVTTEEICREAICIAKLNELISIGDIAVVTAGIPSTTLGADGESLSNMMRIVVVE